MTRVASTRSIGRGLSRVEPQGGVLVAYAAKAGEIALDGDAGNSPFVVALTEQLMRPGVEVGFLFRKVRDSVLKQTNGTQEPYTYGSLPGDEELYFRPPVNWRTPDASFGFHRYCRSWRYFRPFFARTGG